MSRYRVALAALALLAIQPSAGSGPASSGEGYFHAAEVRREVVDAIAYEDRYDPGHVRLVFSDVAFDRAAMASGGIDLTDFLHHPGAMLDFKIDGAGVVDMLIVSAGEHSQYLTGPEVAGLLHLDRYGQGRIGGRVEAARHRIRFDLPVLAAGE